MSRNGSGTYTLPAGNPVVTGTTISSTWANNTLTDIATALTGSLAADGQTTATGNLKMGNNRITGLADGLASTDAATVSQVAASVAGLGTMSTQNANAVAITGGAINGTTVGASTAATGRFTTLEVTTTSTFTGNGSFNGTGALKIPAGTTAEQPTPVTGQIRFNSTDNRFEGYGASSWLGFGSTAGGSNTQVQYNNSGALAGSSNLTFDGTTLTASALSVTNNLSFNSGYGSSAVAYGCRAWVNFNGTGTPAIRASGNVSSITDNGTGDYTVNFTTAMPDANYAVIASVSTDNSNNAVSINTQSTQGSVSAPTTTAVRMQIARAAVGYVDSEYVNVSIFR